MLFGKSKTYLKALKDAEVARKKSLRGVFIGAIGLGISTIYMINKAEEYGHSRMFSVCTEALKDTDVDDDIDEH